MGCSWAPPRSGGGFSTGWCWRSTASIPAASSALERSLRSRNRLLEVRNYDDHWCDAVERETAELAVAVAATRGQTAAKLAAMLRARGAASAFPSAQIMLDGWMENALLDEPATAVEDRYREILRDNRARDAAAGRTLDGPHLTDLQVIFAPKSMPARDASTGEQKALLIGLVLAHATSGRGDDRHRAAAAARRGGGASRSRPAHGVVR